MLLAPSTVFVVLLFVRPLVAGIGQAVHGDGGFTTRHLRQTRQGPRCRPSSRVLLTAPPAGRPGDPARPGAAARYYATETPLLLEDT